MLLKIARASVSDGAAQVRWHLAPDEVALWRQLRGKQANAAAGAGLEFRPSFGPNLATKCSKSKSGESSRGGPDIFQIGACLFILLKLPLVPTGATEL